MKYRLGLDMGATSIGWSVYNIEKNTIENFGVRIFDDGREDKSKASLCVKRRNARGARRLNNRKHIQTQHLLSKLVDFGLLPAEEQERKSLKLLNPYQLRAKALDEKISLYEIGRILFQLAKRKGFKSNRKDDKEEGGKLKKGYQDLLNDMEAKNARTYGEYLYKIHLNNPKDNLRLKNTFDETGKFKGGLFPFREVYQDEFNQIWEKQKEYYPNILTDERKTTINNILYFQRPLKEQEEGFCTFETNEHRIPKAHPLFQEFRIWQFLLDLKFCNESSSEYKCLEYNTLKKLINILQNPVNQKVTKQGTIAYSNIKKELGLDKNGLFNFEKMSKISSEYEKGMLVNKTQNAINQSEHFKSYWDNFSEKQKHEIINVLARPQNYINFPQKLSIEEEDKIIIEYLCKNYAIPTKAAHELLFDIPLEDDYGSLSEKAICKILPFMKEGMAYTDACQEAGYDHSKKDYTKVDKLPYYGKILEQHCLGKKLNYKNEEEQYGKINNATVHVALNQIRYLVNDLIDSYGKPYDISIEYARDLNASAQERLKMMDTRDKNEVENQKIIKEMNVKICERQWKKRDIQKYKIWKQMGTPKGGTALDRECPFTGKKISVSDLINGQMFQIEHIIPFSRSLDDSLENKVIACVTANRYKANRTPYEAFGESKDGYNWAEIQKRAKKLSFEQQWRFSKDAMKKFEDKQGPIARSLNDTRYMTKILHEYLLPIVREDGLKTVQSVVGKLTAMVRKSWGLNLYKNTDNSEEYRAFHNHHAIDALIVSAIDRGNIEKTARDLKNVAFTVKEEFKDEFYKFRDETISKEEKQNLHKRIKDFTLAKEEGIVSQHIPLPESIRISEIIDRVEKINISHKPKLKNIKDSTSTIGKLHEDTAYGLRQFKDDTSLTGIFVCKGDVKEVEITDYIPMFYDKADKNAYYDAYKNWFILNGKSKTLVANSKEEKQIKTNLNNEEQKAIQVLRDCATKAFKWFVGGGNFCAEIYQINPENKINNLPTNDRAEWKGEIVSNYNATIRQARNENISYWKYKYPNAKRIMTLKRNDMVVATFSREQAFDEKFPKGIQEYVRKLFEPISTKETVDVLFRVKKMGSNGICLTPHNIAKEVADTKSWIASYGAMKRYNVKKVNISPSGRISYAQ